MTTKPMMVNHRATPPREDPYHERAHKGHDEYGAPEHPHRRSVLRPLLPHAYSGGYAGLVPVAFPLHDFNGLGDDGLGFS
jgi:hypothetical protein